MSQFYINMYICIYFKQEKAYVLVSQKQWNRRNDFYQGSVVAAGHCRDELDGKVASR